MDVDWKLHKSDPPKYWDDKRKVGFCHIKGERYYVHNGSAEDMLRDLQELRARHGMAHQKDK